MEPRAVEVAVIAARQAEQPAEEDETSENEVVGYCGLCREFFPYCVNSVPRCTTCGHRLGDC